MWDFGSLNVKREQRNEFKQRQQLWTLSSLCTLKCGPARSTDCPFGICSFQPTLLKIIRKPGQGYSHKLNYQAQHVVATCVIYLWQSWMPFFLELDHEPIGKWSAGKLCWNWKWCISTWNHLSLFRTCCHTIIHSTPTCRVMQGAPSTTSPSADHKAPTGGLKNFSRFVHPMSESFPNWQALFFSRKARRLSKVDVSNS